MQRQAKKEDADILTGEDFLEWLTRDPLPGRWVGVVDDPEYGPIGLPDPVWEEGEPDAMAQALMSGQFLSSIYGAVGEMTGSPAKNNAAKAKGASYSELAANIAEFETAVLDESGPLILDAIEADPRFDNLTPSQKVTVANSLAPGFSGYFTRIRNIAIGAGEVGPSIQTIITEYVGQQAAFPDVIAKQTGLRILEPQAALEAGEAGKITEIEQVLPPFMPPGSVIAKGFEMPVDETQELLQKMAGGDVAFERYLQQQVDPTTLAGRKLMRQFQDRQSKTKSEFLESGTVQAAYLKPFDFFDPKIGSTIFPAGSAKGVPYKPPPRSPEEIAAEQRRLAGAYAGHIEAKQTGWDAFLGEHVEKWQTDFAKLQPPKKSVKTVIKRPQPFGKKSMTGV